LSLEWKRKGLLDGDRIFSERELMAFDQLIMTRLQYGTEMYMFERSV